MHCPGCGAEVAAGSVACTACGARLHPLPEPRPWDPRERFDLREEAYQRATQRRYGRAFVGMMWGFCILAIVVLSCVLVGALPSMRTYHRLTKPVEVESQLYRRVHDLLEGPESAESAESAHREAQ